MLDKGARWEPAEVGAAVRELLAKAPPPGAGLRRAVAVRARRRIRDAPLEVQDRWRAQRRLDRRDAARPARGRRRRRTSRSSTATCGSRSTTCDRVARVHAARLVAARRATGRRRVLAAPELVGSRRVLLGDLALRRDREPDHADACGAHEVGFILRQTGARVVAVPRDVPRHRLRRADARRRLRRRADRGARRRDPVRHGDPVPDLAAGRRRRPRVILWTSGTTSEPKGVVHTHQIAARRGRHASPPRTRCGRAKRCSCRCRSRTSPASPTACCCRSPTGSPRCSWTRGSRRPALELARDASASRS